MSSLFPAWMTYNVDPGILNQLTPTPSNPDQLETPRAPTIDKFNRDPRTRPPRPDTPRPSPNVENVDHLKFENQRLENRVRTLSNEIRRLRGERDAKGQDQINRYLEQTNQYESIIQSARIQMDELKGQNKELIKANTELTMKLRDLEKWSQQKNQQNLNDLMDTASRYALDQRGRQIETREKTLDSKLEEWEEKAGYYKQEINRLQECIRVLQEENKELRSDKSIAGMNVQDVPFRKRFKKYVGNSSSNEDSSN